MSTKTALLFNILLNHFGLNSNKQLLTYLPEQESAEITQHSSKINHPEIFLSWPQQSITRTHYSWLQPVIERFSQTLQMPLIAALPQPQSTKLQEIFKHQQLTEPLAPPIKHFLLHLYFQHWKPEQIFTPDYLPHTPLSPLLNLSKNQVVELIDFLALYDLSDIIRTIVDKKLLENINNYLSPQKQECLRCILQQKHKLTAPKLSLSTWNGQPENLHFLLHKRGLQRFSMALCTQSEDFLWHITHILDTGRGKIIINNYKKTQIDEVNTVLIQQIQFLLNFLYAKSNV